MKAPKIHKPTPKAAPKKAPRTNPVPTISGPDKAEPYRWQAEDGLRTLQRAEEIKADKALMSAIQKQAQTQVATIQKVVGKNAPDRPTRKAPGKGKAA